MAVKKSRQRDAILAELRSRTDHPTAEELYLALKTDYPNLSLGTVYRNLNMLSVDGTISKISLGGADHFDGNIQQHYHFHCNECGRLYDVEMPYMHELEEKAKDYVKGTIQQHRLTFSGVCENCLK